MATQAQDDTKGHIHGEHRFAVLTDLHVPYHDPRAIDVACKVLRWHNPSVVVLGGDFWDFYAVSAYDRNPDRRDNLQEEIDSGEPVLRQLINAAPDADWWMIPGNHEDRLRRWLWRNPQISGLRALQLENLLPLQKFGIKYAQEVLLNDHVLVTHGDSVRKHSGASVRGEIEKRRYGWSIVQGHVHRSGEYSTWSRHGEVWGIEAGCLCDMNVEYGRALDWQHGMVIGFTSPTISRALAVRITDGRAVLPTGEVFEA